MDFRKSLTVVIVLLFLAVSGVAASDPVGMVLRTGGESQLLREGQQNELRMAEVLYAGDQIVAEGSTVTFMYCPSNEMVTLEAGSTVELSPTELVLVKGSGLGRSPARGCSLPRVALGSESLERVGGLRARGLAPIEIYLGGNVSSGRPVFEWAALENDAVYLVTLKSGMGAILWQEKTEASRLEFPEGAETLQPGSYLWEILAEENGEPVAQQLARFSVKPDPELAQATVSDDPSEQLLQATLLENSGYFSEAASYYRALRKANPEDDRFTRRLAWLYWNSGLITAANVERDRLDKENTP
jgi:hypothetical protein